jgi:hypothetical protein
MRASILACLDASAGLTAVSSDRIARSSSSLRRVASGSNSGAWGIGGSANNTNAFLSFPR